MKKPTLRAMGLGAALLANAGCLYSCFVRGTRVATPKGPRAIEDLQAGDEVCAFSLVRNEVVVRPVVAVLKRTSDRIYRVAAGEFAIAGVTGEHPFWDDAAKVWREAGDLALRSELLAWPGTGAPRALPVTTLECAAITGPTEVFNLSVGGEEANYFANGLLVHNKEPAIPDDVQSRDAIDEQTTPADVQPGDAGDDTIYMVSDSCFVRGTRVATPDGPRAIEDLREGDTVYSYSIERREVVERRIAATRRATGDRIFRVAAGEFSIAGVTGEHPFWNAAEERWCVTGAITLRAELLAWPGGGAPRALSVTALALASNAPGTEVFNLTIDGEEANYFANGILVHNKTIDVVDADANPPEDAGDSDDAAPGADASLEDGGEPDAD